MTEIVVKIGTWFLDAYNRQKKGNNCNHIQLLPETEKVNTSVKISFRR